jgi:hypothetical protein
VPTRRLALPDIFPAAPPTLRMAQVQRDGRDRAMGIVDFATGEDMDTALRKLDDTEFRCQGRPPGGARMGWGRCWVVGTALRGGARHTCEYTRVATVCGRTIEPQWHAGMVAGLGVPPCIMPTTGIPMSPPTSASVRTAAAVAAMAAAGATAPAAPAGTAPAARAARSAPAAAAAAPSVMTAAPSVMTAAPSVTTAAPSVTTAAPSVMTAAPAGAAAGVARHVLPTAGSPCLHHGACLRLPKAAACALPAVGGLYQLPITTTAGAVAPCAMIEGMCSR